MYVYCNDFHISHARERLYIGSKKNKPNGFISIYGNDEITFSLISRIDHSHRKPVDSTQG